MNRLLFISLLGMSLMGNFVQISSSGRRLGGAGANPTTGTSPRKLPETGEDAAEDGGTPTTTGDFTAEFRRLRTHTEGLYDTTFGQYLHRGETTLDAAHDIDVATVLSEGGALPATMPKGSLSRDELVALPEKYRTSINTNQEQLTRYAGGEAETGNRGDKKFKNPLETMKEAADSVASSAALLSSAHTSQAANLNSLARVTKRISDLTKANEETSASSRPVIDTVQKIADQRARTAQTILRRNPKVADLKTNIHDVKTQKKSLKKQRDRLNSNVVRSSQKLKVILRNRAVISKKIALVRSKIQRQKLRLQERIFQLNALSKVLAIFINLAKLPDQTREQIRLLDEKITEQASLLNDNQSAVAARLAEIDDIQGQTTKMNNQITELDKRLNDLRAEKQGMQEEISLQEAQERELAASLIAGENALATAAELSNAITQELSTLTKQQESLMRTITQMDRKIGEVDTSFNRSLGDLMAAKRQLESSNDREQKKFAESYSRDLMQGGTLNLTRLLKGYTGRRDSSGTETPDRSDAQSERSGGGDGASTLSARGVGTAIGTGARKLAGAVVEAAPHVAQAGRDLARGVRDGAHPQ